ncbi:MAG: hypothetical protein K9N10_22785 [Deltaproteobacteria bacterium]|nr:hypothetical protein [Deltaproteobacteria bacterium]
MKHDVEQHIKFKLLKRKLSLNLWQAKGLLESIWGVCATHTMQGNIGKLSNEEICVCIEWEGDPDKLFAILIECGWIDECAEYRLIIHDWAHHCPTYIKGNLSRHRKTFAQPVAKQSAKHGAKRGAKRGATPQPQAATKPNQTKYLLHLTMRLAIIGNRRKEENCKATASNGSKRFGKHSTIAKAEPRP